MEKQNQEVCENQGCCGGLCYCFRWFWIEFVFLIMPIRLFFLRFWSQAEYQKETVEYELDKNKRFVEKMIYSKLRRHVEERHNDYLAEESIKNEYEQKASHIIAQVSDGMQRRFYLNPDNQGELFSFDPAELNEHMTPSEGFIVKEYQMKVDDFDKARERYEMAHTFLTMAMERFSLIKHSLAMNDDLDMYKEVGVKLSIESKEGQNFRNALNNLREQIEEQVEKLKRVKQDSAELNKDMKDVEKEANRSVNYTKEKKAILSKLCAKIGVPVKQQVVHIAAAPVESETERLLQYA